MVAILIDNVEYDEVYGILTVEGKTREEVQNKINDIKGELYEEGIDDWTIDDVLDKFPAEWDWSYETEVGYLYI